MNLLFNTSYSNLADESSSSGSIYEFSSVMSIVYIVTRFKNWSTKCEMTIKLCDTNRVHSNSDCQMANFDEMRRNDINHSPLLDTRQSFVLGIQV